MECLQSGLLYGDSNSVFPSCAFAICKHLESTRYPAFIWEIRKTERERSLENYIGSLMDRWADWVTQLP